MASVSPSHESIPEGDGLSAGTGGVSEGPGGARIEEPDCRAGFRATTPRGYHWYRHVGLIAVFDLAGLGVTLANVESPGLGDVGWLAVFLLLLNFGEYATHRWSLHRRVFPRILYHRHVVEHHGFFTFDAMAIRDAGDLRWVLFPWWALPLLLVTTVPLALLVAVVLASPRAGWLFLLAVTLYYGIYEVLHALAHMPDDWCWAAHPRVRALTWHHRVHHDPRLMHRWNFNFVLAPFDRLLGTTRPEPAGRGAPPRVGNSC